MFTVVCHLDPQQPGLMSFVIVYRSGPEPDTDYEWTEQRRNSREISEVEVPELGDWEVTLFKAVLLLSAVTLPTGANCKCWLEVAGCPLFGIRAS